MKRNLRKIRQFFVPLAFIFLATSFTGAYFSDSIEISENSFEADTWVPGPAVVSEVYYDPSSTDDTGLEAIEIKNIGSYVVNLNGYILHHATSGSNDFTFPAFSLMPGAKAVVHVNLSGTNTDSELFWSGVGNLADENGSVSLFKKLPKDETTIIDFVQYGSGGQNFESKAALASIWTAGTFVSDVETGHSISLLGPDNNLVSDWQDQITPNPGS